MILIEGKVNESCRAKGKAKEIEINMWEAWGDEGDNNKKAD